VARFRMCCCYGCLSADNHMPPKQVSECWASNPCNSYSLITPASATHDLTLLPFLFMHLALHLQISCAMLCAPARAACILCNKARHAHTTHAKQWEQHRASRCSARQAQHGTALEHCR
jgi:hypothetical protein